MTANLMVGVCGAGAMGSGIAQVAAQAGARVILFDPQDKARDLSRIGVVQRIAESVARGRLVADVADSIIARMCWTADLADLSDCEIVIEAIVEDLGIKQALFTQLEDVVAVDTILASNTSSLPIGRLARPLRHPERVVGMHFFNPAIVMKLVEVISGPATQLEVARRVEQLATAWGKVAVPVADMPGFIVNRIARPFYAEAFRAMQEGAATPEVIDHLFKAAAGFRMGPLELTDLIGQDVNFEVARSIYESYFGQTRFVPQLAQAALVDAGWLGRKSGRGVYDYADGAGIGSPLPTAGMPLPNAPSMADFIASDGSMLQVDGVVVRFTRGMTAHAEAKVAQCAVVLLDWFAPAGAKAIAFAASNERAIAVATGLISSWGMTACHVADRPGLIVMRTLAQIANSAGDAVFERASNEDGVDKALCYGANYPFGPFAWVDGIGAPALCRMLQAITAATGEAMYNPSQYWMARDDD